MKKSLIALALVGTFAAPVIAEEAAAPAATPAADVAATVEKAASEASATVEKAASEASATVEKAAADVATKAEAAVRDAKPNKPSTSLKTGPGPPAPGPFFYGHDGALPGQPRGSTSRMWESAPTTLTRLPAGSGALQRTVQTVSSRCTRLIPWLTSSSRVSSRPM